MSSAGPPNRLQAATRKAEAALSRPFCWWFRFSLPRWGTFFVLPDSMTIFVLCILPGYFAVAWIFSLQNFMVALGLLFLSPFVVLKVLRISERGVLCFKVVGIPGAGQRGLQFGPTPIQAPASRHDSERRAALSFDRRGAGKRRLEKAEGRLVRAGRSGRGPPPRLSRRKLGEHVGVHRKHAAVDGVVDPLRLRLSRRGAERDEERQEMLVGRMRAHALRRE